jgi:hypothetical protein
MSAPGLLTVGVPLGPASEVAVGVEQGARYELIAADGTRAVLNDRTDLDFIGFLTAPPGGLDSAEVRESADLLVEGDGGVHGSFYFGRRPVVLEGIIDPTPDPSRDFRDVAGVPVTLEPGEVANKRINRLQRVTRAMAADMRLRWTAANGPTVEVALRRQQPLRIAGRLPKTFQAAMIAADPRILRASTSNAAGAVVTTETGSVSAKNDGNAPAPAVVTVRAGAGGTVTGPINLRNLATGQAVRVDLNLSASQVLVVDFRARTVTVDGGNRYDAVNFAASSWWDLAPGDNPLRVVAAAITGAPTFDVSWRDAWL